MKRPSIGFLASMVKNNPPFRRFLLKRKISLEYPMFLLIEVTNHCNMKCVFCPRETSPRKLGFMSFQTLENVLNDSSKYGKRLAIGFQKDGEPLIHKELEEMISYAKKRHAAHLLHVATNGLLLDEKRAEKIIKSGLDDLMISIDSSSPDTYKKVKGINAFALVEENVRRFLDIRKDMRSSKPFVRVKIINMRGTEKEIPEFKRKWGKIADRVEIKDFVKWGVVEDNSVIDSSNARRYPCTSLWYLSAINWDGGVPLCCGDYKSEKIVGNINERSLYDIWHDERLISARRAHLDGRFEDVEVCDECNLWLLEEDLGHWLKKLSR